jgi:hypothetical protein
MRWSSATLGTAAVLLALGGALALPLELTARGLSRRGPGDETKLPYDSSNARDKAAQVGC